MPAFWTTATKWQNLTQPLLCSAQHIVGSSVPTCVPAAQARMECQRGLIKKLWLPQVERVASQEPHKICLWMFPNFSWSECLVFQAIAVLNDLFLCSELEWMHLEFAVSFFVYYRMLYMSSVQYLFISSVHLCALLHYQCTLLHITRTLQKISFDMVICKVASTFSSCSISQCAGVYVPVCKKPH